MTKLQISLLVGRYTLCVILGYIEIFLISYALFHNVILFFISLITGCLVWRNYMNSYVLALMASHTEEISEKDIKNILDKAFKEAQEDFEKNKKKHKD